MHSALAPVNRRMYVYIDVQVSVRIAAVQQVLLLAAATFWVALVVVCFL